MKSLIKLDKNESKDELILYKLDEKQAILEVIVKHDSVWLNRQQMSQLFDRDVKTIGKHISNALKEELAGISVVANFATTAADGKVYQTEHYNLDMIISIGYRVKSQRGIQFRMWANSILKEHLLKGYTFNRRINRIEDAIEEITERVNNIDLQIKSNNLPTQGIFFEGQVFDAYVLSSKIIRSAKKRIVLIDNYIDENTLTHLTKKRKDINVLLLTKKINDKLILDVKKANEQFSHFEIKEFSKSHDRFLIIDDTIVYHLGASLKDLGKKWFAFSTINKKTVGEILDQI